MCTIGDDLLRQGGELRADGTPFGPRIEALVVYNSNPVAVAPDSTRVARGFAREDLFTVVLEHFMTDTADLADYVLPATTQLEHLDVHTSYGHTYAMLNEAAIAPLGEAKPNTQVFRELAARMGFDDACFGDDDEALARIAFRPASAGGVDFAALRAEGWVKLDIAEAPFAEGGFPTASGKARVDVPGLGVPDHVANYESAASSPELARRFPLAMISPPARNFLNSSFVNVTSLRAVEGEPVLEISAIDAAARGITDGRRVRIFNDRGSIVCKAVVGERARPGVVNGLGVWWKKLAGDGKNGNELTHQRLTDIGRAPSFYDCLVEVQAADAAAP
jgi:anaerobic selenocysteine-containing dehydrogenase